MQTKQAGFTLIELVVVIVILGILSAVALPRFVDLSTQAGQAAAQGVAGSISSASSINYASRKAASGTGSQITGCTGAGATVATNISTLLAGGLPAGYTLGGPAAGSCTDGNTTTCTVTNSQTSQIASAVVICVSP